MSGDVGEDAERAAHHDGRHDGEAVQPVGQVHRVRGADDDEVGEHDKADRAERIGDELEERHDQGIQRRDALREPAEIAGRRQPEHRLPDELRLRRQSLGVAVHDLAVVVDPADGAEAERHQQHYPDEAVAQVAPQQRGDGDRQQDQRPAHSGRARLGQVRLGAVVAHRLADFVGGELADHVGPEDQRDRERREASQHRAQREVVEDVEQAHVPGEPLGEFEQHQWAVSF